ncbi:unnamed protein product [Timema podura]|uniref:Uncharacterized protein n=1 Tax=Timema podura TaxID=61482 RepID=A0ABN7NSM3_TIMPD|nr:unnamed protein product [Timema podura]
MQVKTTLMMWAMILNAVLFALSQTVMAANYRKLPFNGGMYGKRDTNLDFDGTGKALSSMCEIAFEACAVWLPQPETSGCKVVRIEGCRDQPLSWSRMSLLRDVTE